jgi:hypothetical protein
MRSKIVLVVLVCGLCGVSLAQDTTLSNMAGLNFISNKTVQYGLNNFPCSDQKDTFDFFWCYYDECVCMCPCCAAIVVASRLPFFVSKKAMNYSDFKANYSKLVDTTLFVKCSTSTSPYPFGTGCRISSAKLMSKATGMISAVNEDSLYQRMYFFCISRWGSYIPLKINKIYKHYYSCSMGYGMTDWPEYDSIAISYGNSVTGTVMPTSRPPAGRTGKLAQYRGLFTLSGRSMPGTAKSNAMYVDGTKAELRSSVKKP